MVNKKYLNYGTAPSVIRELFSYGLKKAAEVGPENVFDFSLGNPSVPAPASVNESVASLVGSSDPVKLHGYSPAGGFEEAKRAVAEDMNSRFGIESDPKELFLTCGCAPALVSVAKALTSSDTDEFVLLAPYFPEYEVFFGSGGGCISVVPADTKDFQIDFDELDQRINPRTVAVVVNSPNNPSGTVYSEGTISKLAALLREKSEEYAHPIYIVSDEPYRELVYDGVEVPFIPKYYDDTIVCYSWSKSLSLPGERLGYVYVPSACADSAEVYAAVAGAAREIGHVCAPSMMQRMIELCAGERPDLEAYDRNRRLLYDALTEYGYECAKPDGAFYMFVKAPGGDADAFSDKAKLEHNLLVVPGADFGCPEFFRLAYCVDTEMIERSLPAFKALIGEHESI